VERFVIIEIVIFLLFILLLRYLVSSRSNINAFIAVSVITTVMEVLNERFFSGQGVIYPDSLLYFPYFKFPVAIICMGVIYSFLIYSAANKIIAYVKNSQIKIFMFLVSISVLNSASLIVENAGISSGYWIHQKVQSVTASWYVIYGFYFVIIMSGAVFVLSGYKKLSISGHRR